MQRDQDAVTEQFLKDAEGPDRPLIDAIIPISELRAEYAAGSPTFIKQIDWLESHGYKELRRAKGDGDCFYRSLAFAYVERIMQDSQPELGVGIALSILGPTLPMLARVGFDAVVYEDVYEIFVELLQSIIPDRKGNKLTSDQLLRRFQDPMVSFSIVSYLRLVTSAQLRLTKEEVEVFLFHPETGLPMVVERFCEQFVEPCGKDADHVQVEALCRALQLNVDVAYLDGRGNDDAVTFVHLRNSLDEKSEPLKLLYRPGHFDILIGPSSG
ncbi:peptidase C65 Otubain-domain-containing protein [Collybia nuda]|uniref:ubiquitinyl hydrolase 1 n=1 Tax=Collybia nuda TaxID=64659 RepID=A0A9P5Y8M2_9AGAR|nr:peptidase C65 Otubain-domain-containing protein [Collybia nuda]